MATVKVMEKTEDQKPGPMIYRQMAKVMAEVGAISKDRKNQAQGYTFRGVDDVYQAVQLVFAKHGIVPGFEVLDVVSEERQSKGGGAIISRLLTVSVKFYAEDGSFIPFVVIGEGFDSGDKASNKAMSVADKYAVLIALKIPTAEAKDPENDSHEVEAKASGPAIYRGKTTADQNRLIAIAKPLGVTATVDLIALSKTCEGIAFDQLEAATKEWLDQRPK